MIDEQDNFYSIAKDIKKREKEKDGKDWDKINMLDKFIVMR
jgi:uncharacterized membrane protein